MALTARIKALAPRGRVTWMLVALNIAAWLGAIVFGADPLRPTAAQLLLLGGNAASEVQQGQWWRLLTSSFLHIGPVHLALNMLGLLLVGPTVERLYGHWLFLLLYIGAALAGSAASLHFSASSGVSVGASAAVFGCAGTLLTMLVRHRRQLPQKFGRQALAGIVLVIVAALVQGLAPGVDNAAHVGGLLAGIALALILPGRFDDVASGAFEPQHGGSQWRRSRLLRTALGALAIVAVTALAAAIAPRAPFDLSEAFQASAAMERGMREFSDALEQLQREADDVEARQLSEDEADRRSRMLHAPRFQRLVGELSAIRLPRNDPRAPLLATTLRASSLLLEHLAMESRSVDGRPVAVDPVRSATIAAELGRLNAEILKLATQLKQPPAR